MSQLNVLAVYAAISKHLGLPLRFPGQPGAFDAVYQFTDARLLARALVWAATAPACANRAFNITNGDLVRWRHLWPKVAGVFEMEVGPVLPINLARTMADQEPLWQAMVRHHGLRDHTLSQLVNWSFGDFIYNSAYDHISNLTRARQAGWTESIDSEATLLELLRELRARKIVP